MCVGDIKKPRGRFNWEGKRDLYDKLMNHMKSLCLWAEPTAEPTQETLFEFRGAAVDSLCGSARSCLLHECVCIHKCFSLDLSSFLWFHYKRPGSYTRPQAMLIKHGVCTQRAALIRHGARVSRPAGSDGATLRASHSSERCTFDSSCST